MSNIKIVFDNVNNSKKLNFIIDVFKEDNKNITIYNNTLYEKNSFKKLIKAHKMCYNIILNSIFVQRINDQMLSFTGLNNTKLFNLNKYIKYVENYLHIVLVDNSSIYKNKKITNNDLNISKFWQKTLSDIIINDIKIYYEKYNLTYLYININDESDVKMFKNLIDVVFKNSAI